MFDQQQAGVVPTDAPPAALTAPVTADESATALSESLSWAERPTGVATLAALLEVPLGRCTPAQLLEVLQGLARAEAWLTAHKARVLAVTATEIERAAVTAETDPDSNRTNWAAVHRQVEMEISTALRQSALTTNRQLDYAQQLTNRLPQVCDALAAGQISYGHALAICDETVTLTDDQARNLARRVLPGAATATVQTVRRRLRKACLQLDPASSAERAARATAGRSVTIRPADDGQALLQAVGPAQHIYAMFDVLNSCARQHAEDDPRTTTARRFDALLDGVLHTTRLQDGCPQPSPVPTELQIMMDLPTLLALRDNPAELLGYGPLPASTARQLAASATWRRIVFDPETGVPVDLGRTARHPDAAMRRYILTRDRSCLGPHCYRPAARCHIDHTKAWKDGGRTDKDNLTTGCTKHHSGKHHGWHYQRLPDRIIWTSPHGKTHLRYLTEPDLLALNDPDALNDTDALEDVGSSTTTSDTPATPTAAEERLREYVNVPTDDDQQIAIFCPKPQPGQPLPEIPDEIVWLFHLDEQDAPWPLDANGNPAEELLLTEQEEQHIIDEEDRWRSGRYGTDPATDHLVQEDLDHKLDRERRAQQPWPETPPF